MPFLNFKTISTLAIAGFLSIQSLNATNNDGMDQESNPSTNPLVRVANKDASASSEHLNRLALLRAQVPVEFQNAAIYCRSPNQWLITYMGALGCDTPVLEALLSNLRPTNKQVQAFYAWVKANPEQNLSFSPALTQSIRVIASRYDPNVAKINLMNRQMTTLPHNLWGLSNITSLDLDQNQIVDVSPLSRLTELKRLSLHQNQIVDVSPLRHLTQLKRLSLTQNRIVDVSPLRHLTQLTWLSLEYNQIVDVSPLRHLTQLTGLYLGHNQIVDVSLLATLTQLQILSLNQNQIIDVSPLGKLTQLKRLTLWGNPATDADEKQQRVQEYFTSNTQLYLKGILNIVRGTRH